MINGGLGIWKFISILIWFIGIGIAIFGAMFFTRVCKRIDKSCSSEAVEKTEKAFSQESQPENDPKL